MEMMGRTRFSCHAQANNKHPTVKYESLVQTPLDSLESLAKNFSYRRLIIALLSELGKALRNALSFI
jgi:hypothetical protein